MDVNLRKVVYTYENPNDYEFSESLNDCYKHENKNEMYQKRDGYFHDWTNFEIQSPQSGEFYIIKMALIEDAVTGRIHKIDSECITFK